MSCIEVCPNAYGGVAKKFKEKCVHNWGVIRKVWAFRWLMNVSIFNILNYVVDGSLWAYN
jgi:hypothetical protein